MWRAMAIMAFFLPRRRRIRRYFSPRKVSLDLAQAIAAAPRAPRSHRLPLPVGPAVGLGEADAGGGFGPGGLAAGGVVAAQVLGAGDEGAHRRQVGHEAVRTGLHQDVADG